MATEPGWDVLLIGGGGSVGKTHAASRLARRFGAGFLQADDVRLVLQRAVPASTQPDLHFFLNSDIRTFEVEEALARQEWIGRFVSHKLEVVIAHHVATRQRLVIDGDSITPELGTLVSHAGRSTAGRVRAVFVHEPELERVFNALRLRQRAENSEETDRRWAAFHHAHGELLAERARELGMPVIPARPWGSLPARVTRAAGL